MKRALTVAALVLSLSGWGFGEGSPPAFRVFGGASLARYSGLPDAGAAQWSADRMRDRFGPAAGVGIELALGSSGRLAWVGSFEYGQKGAKIDFLYFDPFYPDPIMMIPVTFTMDVLSSTQLLKVRPLANGIPYLLGGLEVSYVIDHRSPLMPQLESLTKKIDLGLVAGLGGELLTGSWTPFLEARYHLGLVDLSKGVYMGIGGFPSLKTRCFVFLAGVRVRSSRGDT